MARRFLQSGICVAVKNREAFMQKNAVANTSVWTDATLPDLESPHGHQSCEVCVIGAGIAGLTTAYTLSGMGKSVIVLDAVPREFW